nr:hypothetical protein [Tanacetum cinerariifolium]
MVEQAKLKLDLVGKLVDHTDYQSMIGSLMYVTSSRPDIMFATYADHAGCHLDRKTESEYVAVSGCCAQVLWMRTQLTDYGFFYDKVSIYCDSKSANAILCNPVQHTRTKHIDVRNLFPPLDNPELTIRRRSRTDPTLEMAAEGPGDLPVPDLRTMEELCQQSLNGQGGIIAPIAIQAMNFGLKNDMIQQV